MYNIYVYKSFIYTYLSIFQFIDIYMYVNKYILIKFKFLFIDLWNILN